MSEPAKRNAALKALEKEIHDGQILGVGTGSTVAIFIEELGKRVLQKGWDIICVPSSLNTYSLCLKAGLKLTTLEAEPQLDITIDGADEVDPKLNLIKGGGGALTREKILAAASKRLAIMVDESKIVRNLGEKHPVPIEVLPFAQGFVETQLRKLKLSKIDTRMSSDGKDGPVITDNGNLIIDLHVRPLKEPSLLAAQLKSIPGVVENGIFPGMANVVYVGEKKGVRVLA